MATITRNHGVDGRGKVIWGNRRKVIWGRGQLTWVMTAVLMMAGTIASAQERPIDPLAPAGKFRLAAERSWIGVAAATTGLWHPESAGPDPSQLPVSTSARFAVAAVDNTIGTFMTTAVVPTLLQQDPRYVARGSRHGGFSRAAYAASRVLLTRSDSGPVQFNYSRVAGNAGAVGISHLYDSSTDHSVSGTLTSIGIRLAVDAAANEFREFWPDIRRTVFRH